MTALTAGALFAGTASTNLASAQTDPPPDPVPGTEAAAGCADFYEPPGNSVGPEPLNVCQWDMRIINATIDGSYAENQGEGATIGIIDTGIDLSHPDIAPNLDESLSCSFIRPGNPQALPQEIDPSNAAARDDENGAFNFETDGPYTGGCATKSAVQDYNGHGTHVGGTAAAPINEYGVSGVAPEATLVGLKAGNADGWFYTQEVVDALIYAGDKRLDVVNMSFFADPFLFNCKNDSEQRAIVKAISAAAQYAHNRGVVLVASAGNEAFDSDHPPEDADFTQPDRPIGNECVVLPAELPWVNTVSAIGPQKRLSFYSTYGNSKTDVTSPGGDSRQALEPYGRVLNAWSGTADPIGVEGRDVEECRSVGGAPVCAHYVWIQGTSMAAPHATGVAALIRAVDPDLPPMAVTATMENTAMPMACPEDDDRCTGTSNGGADGSQTSFYGNGLTDALAAILGAQ